MKHCVPHDEQYRKVVLILRLTYSLQFILSHLTLTFVVWSLKLLTYLLTYLLTTHYSDSRARTHNVKVNCIITRSLIAVCFFYINLQLGLLLTKLITHALLACTCVACDYKIVLYCIVIREIWVFLNAWDCNSRRMGVREREMTTHCASLTLNAWEQWTDCD